MHGSRPQFIEMTVTKTLSLIAILITPCLLTAQEGVGIITEDDSGAGHFRVCWNADPTTKAIIAWTQFTGFLETDLADDSRHGDRLR